ncbi:3564_t:CDS:2, partial [Ambispora gerdemannii]
MSTPVIEVSEKDGFTGAEDVEKFKAEREAPNYSSESRHYQLKLTKDDLKEWGMPGGPIIDTLNFIERLKSEEQVITTEKKRKWMVNGAITPAEIPLYFFADPTERNIQLLNMIEWGDFVALYGPQTSGKTTNPETTTIQRLCLHISNIKSVDEFWQTLGTHLYLDTLQYIGLNTINSASDFDLIFQKSNWKNYVVILTNEFDKLYIAKDDVKSSFFETIRGIKATKGNYAIWSVVAIGPFSILHLNSDNLTTSLFNVKEPFRNPNFMLKQVQFLYKEFADDYSMAIDPE